MNTYGIPELEFVGLFVIVPFWNVLSTVDPHSEADDGEVDGVQASKQACDWQYDRHVV